MYIQTGMYGLPAAGILANKLLKLRLAMKGYFEPPHTPSLWKHVSRPISFTLVVDDFRIKYVGKDLTTSKVMWNSTISTPGARFMCSNVNGFYLETPLP